MGGHSLLATQLIVRMEQEFFVRLPLRVFLDTQTIAGHIAAIAEAETAGAVVSAHGLFPKADTSQPIPLSFSQQGLFILEQFSPGLATYNIPLAFELTGPLDVDILRDSLDGVIERHHILRSRFVIAKGTAHQTIDDSSPGLLQLVDLRSVSEEGKGERARELANQQARRAFDFTNGPMLSACLYRMTETHNLFVVVIHHIAFDGWSVGIFLNELATFYNALAKNEQPCLNPLPIQYLDYAAWQHAQAKDGAFQCDLEYWQTRLHDEPPQIEFLCGHTAKHDVKHAGALVDSRLSPVTSHRLKEFCRTQNTTLFTALLAVWKTVLYRYSGIEDIAVGSAVAGRSRLELESLIGYFVNMIVLRTKISGDLTFIQLLDCVQVASIEAQEHQELPFETLVQELMPSRAADQVPFVQTVFLVQNTPKTNTSIVGIEMSQIDIHTGTAKFPLTLLVTEEEDALRLALEFRTSILDIDGAQRILEHFEHILEQVLTTPHTALDALTLLAPQEQERILVEWNNTSADYPRHRCVHHLFEEQVAIHPREIALKFQGSSVTYQELNGRANQLARFLQSKGVGVESLVVTYLERSVTQIVVLLAILKAGAAYVPLDRAAPKERLKLMLNDTGSRFLFTSASLVGQLPEDCEGITRIDEILPEVNELPTDNLDNVEVGAENLAYVMYTSGSTGIPKGVCVEHRNIVRLVRNTDYVDFSQDQVFLQFAPVSFDASTFEIWGTLLNGAKLVIYPPEFASLEEFGCFLRSERVTTLWLTAGLFHKMVERHLKALSGLRQLLAGGDVLSPNCVRKVLVSCPDCDVINGYGPTESTTFACCHTVRAGAFGNVVPIGRPIANTTVYVLDTRGNPVPQGIVGELYIGGDGVARGYLNSPELTRERFLSDPFSSNEGARMYRTGDLVKWLPDGILEFLGRKDSQIKLRGFRVELGEIESVLKQHPGIAETIVLASDVSSGEKRLIAYVVAPPDSKIAQDDLRRRVREVLPHYMLPSAFVVVEEMPLNANGKINRDALAEYGVHDVDDETPHTEISPQELPLVTLWKRLLPVERVGIDDNFFDLGGHSLLALEMVDALQETFGVRLSLRNFLEHPTISQLSTLILKESTKKRPLDAEEASPA
ncbi:MAG: amino acid adenylation domain-containing protein, partial [Candidatus Hydrogenedentes bacterium]|nr:amino acid adenylation domain-containing protein [Candidatus Hydrogenedentota bacterium]